MAASFFVSGHVGVQEAAHVGLGSIFGVPAESRWLFSLLRRARDLSVEIPGLLAWQEIGTRRATRSPGMVGHAPLAGDGL